MQKSSLSRGPKRTAKVSSLISRVGYLSLTGKKDKASKELVRGMYELGGIYVKFLQVIVNLLPSFPGMTEEIRRQVYDNSPYTAIDIKLFLESNLSNEKLQRLSMLQPIPIATGSFALAYEAILDDSQPVVLKVLRPGAKKQLKADLRLLGLIARAAQPLLRTDSVSTVNIYKGYKETVLREVDYKSEVANCKLMAKIYADVKDIIIPETHEDMSSDQLIVQQKLNGLPLSQIPQENAENYVKEQIGSDLIKQMQTLGFACISTGIGSEYTYGDPHPGNIILMADDQVGLIDFGVVLPGFEEPWAAYAVLQDHHNAFMYKNLDPIKHIITIFKWYNPKTFAALNRIDDEIHDMSIVEEFTEVIRGMIGPKVKKLKDTLYSGGGLPVQQIMEAINGDGNRLTILPHEPTARLARAHSQFWNTAKQLKIERSVSEGVHKKIDAFFSANPDRLGPKPETMSFSDAVQILTDWFTELVERDPLLFGGLFAKIRKTLQDYEKEPTNA